MHTPHTAYTQIEKTDILIQFVSKVISAESEQILSEKTLWAFVRTTIASQTFRHATTWNRTTQFIRREQNILLRFLRRIKEPSRGIFSFHSLLFRTNIEHLVPLKNGKHSAHGYIVHTYIWINNFHFVDADQMLHQPKSLGRKIYGAKWFNVLAHIRSDIGPLWRENRALFFFVRRCCVLRASIDVVGYASLSIRHNRLRFVLRKSIEK